MRKEKKEKISKIGRKRKGGGRRKKRICRQERKEKKKEGKGKGRFLGFRAIDVRQFEYLSWCTQLDLRVDAKKLEFRQTPRGRIFPTWFTFSLKVMVGVACGRP